MKRMVGITAALVTACSVWAGESSFHIAPPPIVEPTFKMGDEKYRMDPMLISIEAPDLGISLSGAGVNFSGRSVMSPETAVDFQGAFVALSGTMPGSYPMSTPTGFYAVPEGDADVTGVSMAFSANLEFLVLNETAASLILFGGPSLSMMSMNMLTPYELVRTSDFAVFTGYTDTLTVTSTVGGFQFGVQAGVNLGDGVTFAPYMVMGSYSGTATLTDAPGWQGAPSYSYTADIPAYSVMSMGMDIIIGDFSVGSMIQSMQSEDSDSPVQTVMIKAGFIY